MKYALLPLALVCAVCPVCILKRKFPDSAYAKTVNKIEKYCPFCYSYTLFFSREKKK